MTFSVIAETVSNTLILLFLVGIPLYAYCKKVPVYDNFVDGAKEGFPVFLRIFPYMLAMLIAISMLRASGAFDLLSQALSPLCAKIGVPTEVVPVALIRPFSASAALAMAADTIHTHGANATLSHLSIMVANAADTTFYIAMIYFGAVGIRRTRHALTVSLLVDVVAMLAVIWIGQRLLS